MKLSKSNPVSTNKSIKSTKIYIFVALECEAKPLITHFDLKKTETNQPYSIYRNDSVILTITGVGKVAMAGGIAYTLAIFPYNPSPILLNIGIAGHKTETIGQLKVVSKIIDDDTGKKFYPSRITKNLAENTSELITVSKPCTLYIQNCLYDMEATAFYEIAVKFSSSELIQSIKVVSDNQQSSIENIHPALVSEWLTNHMNTIGEVVDNLLKLQELITPIELEEYNKILNHWHFSTSGQIKLKSQLIRWKLLSQDNWLDREKENLKSSKEVLQKLEKDISYLEFHL